MFVTHPAGQVLLLFAFLLDERDISSPQNIVFFFFGPEVMTRYQKISHIDYNITLSKPFKFEDVYHLKISQSSAHY